jgi:methyl-accepting chemotaxis protein
MEVKRMGESTKKTLRNKMILLLGVLAIVVAAFQIMVLNLASKGTLGNAMAVVLIICGVAVNFIVALSAVQYIFDKVYLVFNGMNSVTENKVSEKEKELAGRDDEIGALVRKVQGTVSSYSQVVGGIKSASKELTDVSDEFKKLFDVMSSNADTTTDKVGTIANNTVTQAEQTTEMKEKIDAISTSIDKITGNVELLTNSAQVMQEYNNSVQGIIKELVAISSKSSQAIENVRQQTDLTNKSAQEIRTATDIIAGISSQTNLLALNASIEAARAGEHGKGFAVVAEEIRALADQSRESTEQIGKVVTTLLSNSDVSVEITREVSEAFLEQNKKIQDTETIFSSLNKEIEQVHDSVHDINSEVEELETYKDVLGTGINTLDEFAKQNADSAEITMSNVNELRNSVTECDSATKKVVEVSEELIGYIKEFSSDSIKKKVGRA